jgi:hypothetical protein
VRRSRVDGPLADRSVDPRQLAGLRDGTPIL